MTIEGNQQNEESIHKENHEEERPQIELELPHISLAVEETASRKEETAERPHEEVPAPVPVPVPVPTPPFSDKMKKIGKFILFLVVVGVLFFGRFSVPDDEVPCVRDKILNGLEFANTFINTPGKEAFRRAFLIASSFMLDVIFLVTLLYWVFRGKNGRLPVTLAIFYGTRAVVQMFWTSPFPEGNWWYDPGFPSLVVPYGKQSDFFFSGHSGFLIICAHEWHSLKFPKFRNIVLVSAVYTILVLLVYRTHYSIDIFTGVTYAELCWVKADAYKDFTDKLWITVLAKIKSFFIKKKAVQTSSVEAVRSSVPQQEQP